MKNQFEISQSQEKSLDEHSETIYEIEEIQQVVDLLKARLSDPCDPSLRFKHDRQTPESVNVVIARIKKLFEMKKSNPELVVFENDEEKSRKINQTPEFRNKFRTRWFNMMFLYCNQLLQRFDNEDGQLILDEIKQDFDQHNKKYSAIKIKFKNAESMTGEVDYDNYLAERRALIDRVDDFAGQLITQTQENLRKITKV